MNGPLQKILVCGDWKFSMSYVRVFINTQRNSLVTLVPSTPPLKLIATVENQIRFAKCGVEKAAFNQFL